MDAQLLAPYLGVPYKARTSDCADLVIQVQKELFGREVTFPGKRPRPLKGEQQAELLDRYKSDIAFRVDNPQDGDSVLMYEVGKSVAGHVGVYFFISYTPYLLHNAEWMPNGSCLHKVQDLSGIGLTVEGYYRWK